MTVSVLSIDIQSPPARVFETLADMTGYSRWLHPSRTYVSTGEISETPIRKGTTYVDHISGNTLRGEVLEYRPDSLLLFHQATEKSDLAITIRYEMTPAGDGTHLVRTGTIVTHGGLRLVHPLVVRITRAENLRTLKALKSYLERPGD